MPRQSARKRVLRAIGPEGLWLASLFFLASCANLDPGKPPPVADNPASATGATKIRVDLDTDKAAYKTGAPLTITLSADESCFFELSVIRPDGRKQSVYPGPGMPRYQVNKGETLRLPPPASGVTIRAGSQPGTETLVAVASNQPMVEGWRSPGFEKRTGEARLTYRVTR